MSELKKITPESGWIEFQLDPASILQPPVFKCRLRPSNDLENVDLYTDGVAKASELTVRRALACIVEWDLTDGDVAIPCTAAEKEARIDALRLLMAQVTDGDAAQFLGTAILRRAKSLETFLGN